MDDEGFHAGEKASAEAPRMHAAIRARLQKNTIIVEWFAIESTVQYFNLQLNYEPLYRFKNVQK